MYFDYFGLKEAPFRITPNTEYWYAGGQRGEMLAALLYAIGQGEGIIKVVGEVGSGKTMLCRKLVAQLPDTIDSVYLGNPTLEPDDMLAAILSDLGEIPATGRRERLAQLDSVLLARHHAGRRVVVFVEEAQGIALDNLEFLRLLTNLETATDKLLQIVLFGQPELDALLAEPRIRQLKDRITLSLRLAPLNEAEVSDYLRARLMVAGYRGPDLFSPTLIARLTQLSGGLSRRINVLADKTLLAAYASQTHTLAPAHLEAATGDADGTHVTPPHVPSGRTRWIAGIAIASLLLGLALWFVLSRSAPALPDSTPPAAQRSNDPTAALKARAEETRAWLAHTETGVHVIQLASAKEAAQAAVLWESLQASAPQPVRVLYGLRQGAPAWMILAGDFANREAAMAALQMLPVSSPDASAPQGAPFLRTVGKMRTVVLPTG